MKRAWEKWVDFWGVKETGESLALCRMMAGTGVMALVGTVLVDGSWRVLWLDALDGGYRHLDSLPWLIQLLGGAREKVVLGVCLSTMVSGLLLFLGLGSRWMAGLSLLLVNQVIRINFHDGSAYDSVLTNQLLLLTFAEPTATWSLDQYWKAGSFQSKVLIRSWPRYLMVIQLGMIYWATGVQKISVHWLPGGDLAALYYILQDPFWQRWDGLWFWQRYYFWTQVGTAMTWIWEVGAPVLWFDLYRRGTRIEGRGRIGRWVMGVDWRLWYAGIGLVFHLSILLLMRVGVFSWVMLAYYPALWSSAEIRKGMEQITRCGFGRRRHRAETCSK